MADSSDIVVVKVNKKGRGATPAPQTMLPESSQISEDSAAAIPAEEEQHHDEDGGEAKTILIPTATGNSSSNNGNNVGGDMTDYVEVSPEYLKFFYGSWVKITRKGTGVPCPGGILTGVDLRAKTITVRTIQSKAPRRIVNLADHYIHCKKSSEQYMAMKEICHEKEKLKHDRQLFEQQKKVLIRKYFAG